MNTQTELLFIDIDINIRNIQEALVIKNISDHWYSNEVKKKKKKIKRKLK